MKLYILFGQRKESYYGEYAPEALEVIDEYCHDENPEYIKNKLEEFSQETYQFESVKIIPVEVNQEVISRRLRDTDVIKGVI